MTTYEILTGDGSVATTFAEGEHQLTRRFDFGKINNREVNALARNDDDAAADPLAGLVRIQDARSSAVLSLHPHQKECHRGGRVFVSV